MNDLFETKSSSGTAPSKQLSFWEVLAQEWQSFLQGWSNATKGELLKSHEAALRLEQRQQMLGVRLWPLECSPPPVSSTFTGVGPLPGLDTPGAAGRNPLDAVAFELSFGDVLGLEGQSFLRAWSNVTKNDLIKHREQELRLEQRQQAIGAQLWSQGIGATAASSPFGTVIEVESSREQVEALALRASMWLSTLPPAQVEQQYEAWRQELYRRFPSLSAAEIERRVQEFRRIL